LQKCLRRGEEREALYWACELDLAGYGNYVWKRLRIIASEDVGLASTETVIAVQALYENWLEMRKAVKEERQQGFVRIMLVHAVVLLARAPKSRMLDHALIVTYAGERKPLELPDYALDKHTARGARMGRGMEHFVEVGSQLANQADVADPYADEARELLLGGANPQPPPKPPRSSRCSISRGVSRQVPARAGRTRLFRRAE
jgi:replication-associated recombination protein RarA